MRVTGGTPCIVRVCVRVFVPQVSEASAISPCAYDDEELEEMRQTFDKFDTDASGCLGVLFLASTVFAPPFFALTF